MIAALPGHLSLVPRVHIIFSFYLNSFITVDLLIVVTKQYNGVLKSTCGGIILVYFLGNSNCSTFPGTL